MAVPTKKRWRFILRIIALVVVCLALFLADSMGLIAPLVLVTGDAMDWKSHYLAGLSSVNCGRVKVREDASAATQCALQADAKGCSFRVIYNIQGIDARVAGGIVRAPSGRLLALSYDSCPLLSAAAFLSQGPHVTEF